MTITDFTLSGNWREVLPVVRVPQWYINKLKSLEGFRATAYKPKGETNLVSKLTIGYGHYGANAGDTITEEDATKLLLLDIDKVERQLFQLLPALKTISTDRLCCYVDFVFNVGITKFKSSTFYSVACQDVNSPRIPYLFSAWVCSGKTRLKGLVNRRAYFFKLWLRNSNSLEAL